MDDIIHSTNLIDFLVGQYNNKRMLTNEADMSSYKKVISDLIRGLDLPYPKGFGKPMLKYENTVNEAFTAIPNDEDENHGHCTYMYTGHRTWTIIINEGRENEIRFTAQTLQVAYEKYMTWYAEVYKEESK